MTTTSIRPLVIEGATLIDGTGAPPVNQAAVVMRGERIERVGRAGERPEGAEVLDAAGQFLIPGLIDAHAHVEASDAWAVEALRASGVTALRNPATRIGSEHRDPDAPAILAAGPVIDAPPRDRPEADYVSSPAQAREVVRRQAAAGVDLIKLYIKLPPDLLRAAVEQAHALGLRVVGDLRATSWTEAARAGVDFLCHITPCHPALLPPAERAAYEAAVKEQPALALYRWLEHVDLDGPEIGEMIEALAAAEVVVDPTLVALESLLFAGDPAYTEALTPAQEVMPQAYRMPQPGSMSDAFRATYLAMACAQWNTARDLVRRLHRAGVTLLAGTDTPRPWVAPGHSLHRELALLVEAGLSPAEALGAATGGAAAALGLAGELGSVTPGARADLVLLDADPLVDIRHTQQVVQVIVGGELLPPGGGA